MPVFADTNPETFQINPDKIEDVLEAGLGLDDLDRAVALQGPGPHRIALIEVELQVAQKHNVLRICFRRVGGEKAVEQPQRLERVGALGDPALGGVHEALGRGSGLEVAPHGGTGRGDFRLGPRLLGPDDREAGVAGAEVGGEVHDRLESGWLEVVALPLEADLAGAVGGEDPAIEGRADLPASLLRVEGDLGGPDDFEPPERTEIDRLDLSTAPPILGCNIVNPREGCVVVLEWPEGHPAVCSVQFGEGRVFAYTSDPAPHWGCNFVCWDGYPQFWQQALRWLPEGTSN